MMGSDIDKEMFRLDAKPKEAGWSILVEGMTMGYSFLGHWFFGGRNPILIQYTFCGKLSALG